MLGGYVPDFLASFFPEIHAAIDWSQPIELLEAEFVPFLPQSLQGKSLVDKLVKVRLLSGEEAALYIHVDVQGNLDPDFRSRMLRYNVHARERYDQSVISLAILTDDHPGSRPAYFEDSRWGFRLCMDFPMVELLDFRGREKELMVSSNPFSVVVFAHLLSWSRPG